MTNFRTHSGQVVSGEILQNALNAVADDWSKLAADIFEENAYASHVTSEQKASNFLSGLETAERIRRGEENGFWVWQRINEKLTGECVALLP